MMPRPFQIFSQSDYLIQIVDINSHTEWQTVQIQISWLLSQLIWIYTVCKGRVYPGSAGQGLLCLVDPGWYCNCLVGEEGTGSFTFLWFPACMLSVVACLIFLLGCVPKCTSRKHTYIILTSLNPTFIK